MRDTLDRTPLPENSIQISAAFLRTLSGDDLDFMAKNSGSLPQSAIIRLWQTLNRQDEVPSRLKLMVSAATHKRVMADRKHGTIRIYSS